ncbi:MAG: hypothetical protein ACE5JZ_01350 [Kiloniellales bacterium]
MARKPKQLVIAFDEGEVAPAGTYAFELDLTGQSGCEIIEQMTWLIESLNSPYEVRVNQRPVTPDDLGTAYTTLTVWTNDANNADFLWLMHELGVKVYRSTPADD